MIARQLMGEHASQQSLPLPAETDTSRISQKADRTWVFSGTGAMTRSAAFPMLSRIVSAETGSVKANTSVRPLDAIHRGRPRKALGGAARQTSIALSPTALALSAAIAE
jgi:hypothetical protein